MAPKTYLKKHMNGDYVEYIDEPVNQDEIPWPTEENVSLGERVKNLSEEVRKNTEEIDQLQREAAQLFNYVRRLKKRFGAHTGPQGTP